MVWGGYDDNAVQNSGQTTYPKKIWKAVMSRIHEDLPYADFEKPDGIVTATVCKESGKLAIDGVCTNDPRGNMAYTEYFATGTAPTDYCDHHILANICADSGQLAGANCPNTYATGVYVIGGSANTEDAPYLLTEEALANTCTMHNAPSTPYESTPYTPVPGVTDLPSQDTIPEPQTTAPPRVTAAHRRVRIRPPVTIPAALLRIPATTPTAVNKKMRPGFETLKTRAHLFYLSCFNSL